MSKHSDGGAKSKRKPKADQTKPKAKNSYFIFCDEKRPLVRAQNPGISPTDLTRMISIMWRGLSEQEKEEYKEKASYEKRKENEFCPLCGDGTSDLREHLESKHKDNERNENSNKRRNTGSSTLVSTATPATLQREADQAVITQCVQCALPFVSLTALNHHVETVHSVTGIDENDTPLSSLSGTTSAENDVKHHEVNDGDARGQDFAINEVVIQDLEFNFIYFDRL